MCQKAFGSFYGPLVTTYGLVWTRGEPKRFASSDTSTRGFCVDCGTPLTYQAANDEVEISIGSLDDPRWAAPVIQVNPADKLDFVDALANLPVRPETPEVVVLYRSLKSNQHPDHDPNDWPPIARSDDGR